MNSDKTIADEGNALACGLSAIANASGYLFALLAAAILGLIAWYFTFEGAFTVEQQERALVLDFGKLRGQVYKPGWHWNWPYPISEVVRIPVNQQTISSDSFWFYMEPGKKLDDQLLASSVQLTPGKDGYLFTADANIIHTAWKLFYHVSDPLKYYRSVILPSNPESPNDQEFKDPKTGNSFGTRGPRTLLLATFDNVIIKTCAVTKVDDILNSPDFRNKVRDIVSKKIEELDIGITVDSVKMPAKTPPLGTIQAFRALIEAKLKSATLKHNAENYKVKTGNEAESQAAALLADADAYKTEIVASMRSEAKTFDAILKEYEKNPKTVLVALYSDVLSSVLKSADDIFVLRTNKHGAQELRLILNREPPKSGKEK
ncbi:MAG: hypothetical protein GXP32_02395 [Kiritimatiellaeota bacterium]|nr:hypothetical protein [Kiritimatiellota bacterium]